MIPRAKKKKKTNPVNLDDFVRKSNYLNMACSVRTIATMFDFTGEKIKDFVAEYVTLIEELYDGRNTVNGMIQDCKDLTGVDVKFILDNLEMNSKKEKRK